MRAGVLQFAPVRGDKKANFEKIKRLTDGKKADLLVLPELATTGYLFTSRNELASFAEVFPGEETSEFLQELAKSTEGHVVCGVAERKDNRLYNSAVLFNARGHAGTYRKIHLFHNEKDIFEPGNLGFPTFDIGGATIGMMVCFDWIFPESARSLALAGAEIICHAANLVLPYCPAAAVTRAVENHVYYLLADRVGKEEAGREKLSFIGQSRILDVKGQVLISLAEEEKLATADIDTSAARDKFATPRNHLFSDRRPEHYLSD